MKKIRKEQIVQLREHDLNRGHNRSQTPVYPITVPESIEGLAEYLSKAGIAGTTTVDELPVTGEVGKIYYNTSDGKYYTYSTDDGFVSIVDADNLPSTTIPIIVSSAAKHTYVYETQGDNKTVTVYAGDDEDFATAGSTALLGSRDTQGFYLEANKFYELGTVTSDAGLRLCCVGNSTTEVKEYMGRFTVSGSENLTLTCLRSAATAQAAIDTTIPIVIPDDTPDLEPDHTYEFNISASVLAIKDITYTES